MERKHFIKNLRSDKVTESGTPKLPTSEQIEYGELAINYASGKETISLKNSDDEIISFNVRAGGSYGSKDKTVIVSGTEEGGIDFSVNIDNSTIINDTNTGKLSVSSSVFSKYVGESAINITEASEENDKTVQLIINNNDKVLTQSEDGLYSNISLSYDNDNKEIKLVGKNNSIISTIDAHEFIKDGMLGGTKVFIASSASQEIEIKGQTHTFNDLTIGNHYIAFMFIITDGATTTYDWDTLDITNIINVYTSGNGLELNGNSFSVKKNQNSESFFTVDENGVSVNGIQEAINTTVNNAIDLLEKEETTASAENAFVTVKYSETNGIVSINVTENGIASDEELQGIKDSYIKNIKLNNIDGSVSQNVASLNIMGSDVELTNSYTKVEYPSQFEEKVVNYHVLAEDKIDNSFNKIESTIKTLAEEVINDELVMANAISSIVKSSGVVNENNVISYHKEENCSYINNAESLHEATVLLDDGLKELSDNVDENISKIENDIIDNELITANAISSIIESVGLSNTFDEIKYTKKDNAYYIGEADNLNDAVNELDDNLKMVELLITEKLQRAFDDFCIANPSLNRITVR